MTVQGRYVVRVQVGPRCAGSAINRAMIDALSAPLTAAWAEYEYDRHGARWIGDWGGAIVVTVGRADAERYAADA